MILAAFSMLAMVNERAKAPPMNRVAWANALNKTLPPLSAPKSRGSIVARTDETSKSERATGPSRSRGGPPAGEFYPGILLARRRSLAGRLKRTFVRNNSSC